MNLGDRVFDGGTFWRCLIRRAAYLTLLIVASCATAQTDPAMLQQEKALKTEQMLSAAGFTVSPADTGKKQQILANLPSLHVRYLITKKGNVRYWYADPLYCHCIYKGDQKAYQSYEKIKLQQEAAAAQEQAAQMQEYAAMDNENAADMNMYDPIFFPY